jgi:hypothetical protein
VAQEIVKEGGALNFDALYYSTMLIDKEAGAAGGRSGENQKEFIVRSVRNVMLILTIYYTKCRAEGIYSVFFLVRLHTHSKL